MTLYPPSSMFGVLELEVCWESDLKIKVGEEVVPIHPSVLVANRSRFLADLFGPDFADGSRGEKGASASAVPVSPPCPELFLRALHSITTRARPEVLEGEFVGFVKTSAFLQSDELDERLCEAGLSSWRTLTKLPEFRNPCVPAPFLERFLLMAREHEVMSVSDALEVLALWCKEHIDGGDSVLEKLIKISDMEASELRKLQQTNSRFVELLSSTQVYQIMGLSSEKKGYTPSRGLNRLKSRGLS
ncbi:unnamed protein product [Durusdinium trenchii]|uniref:BTB domain-containing protein n=1 Tax=Durusdinium trenchii TaxID=1381693 RepID=A0ABP0Q9E2_9DINO